MIDQQTVRVAALNNRIPNAVLALEVFGAAFAFGLLALYTAMRGRGATTVVLAGGLVTVLLLVIFDLDRPTRGLICLPAAGLPRGATSRTATARPGCSAYSQPASPCYWASSSSLPLRVSTRRAAAPWRRHKSSRSSSRRPNSCPSRCVVASRVSSSATRGRSFTG